VEYDWPRVCADDACTGLVSTVVSVRSSARLVALTTHRLTTSGHLRVNETIQVEGEDGTRAEYRLLAMVNYYRDECNFF
jgi:hypothetical protein